MIAQVQTGALRRYQDFPYEVTTEARKYSKADPSIIDLRELPCALKLRVGALDAGLSSCGIKRPMRVSLHGKSQADAVHDGENLQFGDCSQHLSVLTFSLTIVLENADVVRKPIAAIHKDHLQHSADRLLTITERPQQAKTAQTKQSSSNSKSI